MKFLIFTLFALTLSSVTIASESGYPRSIYQVLNYDDSNFIQNAFGFSIPEEKLPRVQLPFGYKVHKVSVPWSVRGRMLQVVGLADPNKISKNLNWGEKQLQPVLVNGKAVVNLFFLDYDDSGSGAYEEFVIGYLAHRESVQVPHFSSLEELLEKKESYGSAIINYADHLTLGGPDEEFLNFQTAIWAGRVAISYPKFYGRVGFSVDNQTIHASVDQEQVKYYTSGEADAKKAGSLILNIAAKPKTKQNQEPSGSVSFDYHAVSTSGSGLCVMGNHIYSEITEVETEETEMQFSVSGTSESAINLGSIGFSAQKAFYGNNTRIYMFQDKSRKNNCGETSKPYDYSKFYPDRLLRKQK